MKTFLFLICLIAFSKLQAQDYIGYSPKLVKKQMQLYMRTLV